MLLVRTVLLCFIVLSMAAIWPSEARAEGYGADGYYYTDVDAAIDYYGLPPIFHDIAWRESRDDSHAVNPYSGACGPFQFLPATAAEYGYTCYDLQNPYIAAEAALYLYEDYGLSPWALTAY